MEMSPREQVAWACQILGMDGQQDLTLGHVSVRGPGSGEIYMKRMGCGLDEVGTDDVITLDLEGRKLSGQGQVHLEYPLHTEVYRMRPDIGAIVHTHAISGTALAATSARLEMLTHDAVLFCKGLPRYEDSPDLISTADQGREVARALGQARAVLLRNHGVLCVGESIGWAILAALTLDRAVRFQVLAQSLGRLRPMSQAEAEALFARKYPQAFVTDYWSYLVRRAERAGVEIKAKSLAS